jgi:hypothetical protein
MTMPEREDVRVEQERQARRDRQMHWPKAGRRTAKGLPQ